MRSTPCTDGAPGKRKSTDRSAPRPLASGDRIYFGCESGDVYSVDLRGEIKWKFHAKRPVTSSPCEANGLLYFGSVDNLLYALDIKSGWAVWRFRSNHAIISSPAIAQGIVVFGSADGRIYGVDANSSKEKWHFETEGQVTGNPLISPGIWCSADRWTSTFTAWNC